MLFERRGWDIHALSVGRRGTAGGITGHKGLPGTQEHQQGGPGTRPVALHDRLKHGGVAREQHERDIHAVMGNAAGTGVWFARAGAARYAREREAMTSRQPGT